MTQSIDKKLAGAAKTSFLTKCERTACEGQAADKKLADVLATDAPAGVRWHYEKMPEEKHSTIYHPAALKAFREVFKTDSKGQEN